MKWRSYFLLFASFLFQIVMLRFFRDARKRFARLGSGLKTETHNAFRAELGVSDINFCQKLWRFGYSWYPKIYNKFFFPKQYFREVFFTHENIFWSIDEFRIAHCFTVEVSGLWPVWAWVLVTWACNLNSKYQWKAD